MTWAVILAVGAGSYLLRVLPLFVGGRWLESPRVERVIAHAGTAALAALIATGLRRGTGTADDTVATLLSAGVGLAVAVRGGSILRVLLAGACAYAAAWAAISLLG